MNPLEIHSSSAETYQSLIYNRLTSKVLLLCQESGHYTLPESTINPLDDEQGFEDDIRNATGLSTKPFVDTYEDSLTKHRPQAAEAYNIILPHERITHFVLSQTIEAHSLQSKSADAKWKSIAKLPPQNLVDPFSLVNLKRFQTTWAIANSF